ncbi:hypothetical protein CQW23_19644 [Capsicum baccatum]|uniref:Uncharacterized protein n=1 Tax=Capsicum baccatum TaxID=33114 RepID=A0A2G2W6D4_CAPBA|nr:hypothetical protein CQW23_19644 [Capsicum baccatum]
MQDMLCRCGDPVLCGDTIYWFTYDGLHLFAYDMNSKDWLLSTSLENLLHPLKPPKKSIIKYPPVSILFGLPNGQLLVIVEENDARYLSLASLAVSRAGQHSLNVTRHFLQPFSVDAPYFVLHDAKAMVKNAGQGGTQWRGQDIHEGGS